MSFRRDSRSGAHGFGTRFLRTRALLAGGLVLGVGAAMTYASWTDNEYATGAFSASRFGVQSAVDVPPATYTDNPVAPGATLGFDAAGMAPGDIRSATISIRTITSSVAGTVELQTPTVANNAGNTAPLLGDALRYKAYRFTSGTCSATSTPATGIDWIAGNATTTIALTAAMPANSTVLPAATQAAAGSPVAFCFQVSLPTGADNALQGKGAAATWRFAAASS